MTGYHGGTLKRFLLNDLILSKIGAIAGQSMLELGAGNGYFIPLMLQRFSGQVPSRIVISDQSQSMLRIAQSKFRVAGAEYLLLDIRDSFPFADGSFDLILATMVFNEVLTAGLRKALSECYRVLGTGGRLIATVTHPEFVDSLAKRGLLRETGRSFFIMPGADGIPLPVVRRPLEAYTALFSEYGFALVLEEVHANEKVLRAKPGLRKAGGIPLVLVYISRK